jgi:hypothetical protein
MSFSSSAPLWLLFTAAASPRARAAEPELLTILSCGITVERVPDLPPEDVILVAILDDDPTAAAPLGYHDELRVEARLNRFIPIRSSGPMLGMGVGEQAAHHLREHMGVHSGLVPRLPGHDDLLVVTIDLERAEIPLTACTWPAPAELEAFARVQEEQEPAGPDGGQPRVGAVP